MLKQIARVAQDSDEYKKIKDAIYQNKEPRACIICLKFKIDDNIGN